MPDAERHLPAGGIHDVLEVDEDALRRLRAQPDLVGGILHRAHEGAEHQVETARLGELAAALRAAKLYPLPQPNSSLSLWERVRVRASPRFQRLQQVVLPETLVALAALHQRVAEIFDVAAGFPGAGVHQDGGVQPHHVVAPGDDRPATRLP